MIKSYAEEFIVDTRLTMPKEALAIKHLTGGRVHGKWHYSGGTYTNGESLVTLDQLEAYVKTLRGAEALAPGPKVRTVVHITGNLIAMWEVSRHLTLEEVAARKEADERKVEDLKVKIARDEALLKELERKLTMSNNDGNQND